MHTIAGTGRKFIFYARRWLNSLGNRHQCYVCKRTFRHFYPYRGGAAQSGFVRELRIIGSDMENFSCPFCRSHDRERHIYMFFDRLGLWTLFSRATILHFAPERNLKRAIENLNPGDYILADLFPAAEDVQKIDITEIVLPDEHVDLIICNHVLEHVQDDEKAVSELYRVLKKGGFAVLQTPYSSILANSFSDPNIDSDELRSRFYGQADHVRVYGYDIFEKLERAGFCLELKRSSDYFTSEEGTYYGVNPREDLILVSK